MGNQKLPAKLIGYYAKLRGIDNEKDSARRLILQSIVSRLNKRGIDCTVAPKNLLPKFDLVFLVNESELEKIEKELSKFNPSFELGEIGEGVIKTAWQNRVRVHLQMKGFLKVGDRYILKKDLNNGNKYKRAFRVQATIINGYPSLYVDPRTRVMINLTDEILDKADELEEESEIRVRTLPYWSSGILQGRCGFKAKDCYTLLGKKEVTYVEYWRRKHQINVNPEEEMVKVYIPSAEDIYNYPRSCVFQEFRRGESLPTKLKKDPNERVKEASQFIESIQPISFLGMKIEFNISSVITAGFKEYSFKPSPKITVVVGNNTNVPLSTLHKSLKTYGPYAGKIDGKYIVFYPGDLEERDVKKAMTRIERVYSELKLGTLKAATEVEESFIKLTPKVSDYTNKIMELKSRLGSVKNLISLVVLPEKHTSEFYFKSRGKLFESFLGLECIKAQFLRSETLLKISRDEKSGYHSAVNIASQCYIKIGGTGSAVWILNEPADNPIRGISDGSSCYAYYDVSRRPKMKASASAYSALTDSFGRFIATGSKPIGGEKLTETTFYDMILELLEKVSIFSNKFNEVDSSRSFQFKRLVFAKDGHIKDDESEMMQRVINEGIPEEGKEPIGDVLKSSSILPSELVIDIISVNKSPNKRVFELDETLNSFKNVNEGVAIVYDNKSGLLVSASTKLGTVQPLEITFHSHICLNCESIPTPHISEIMDEYYRLTHLDWASIFKQGKYALPQILTQNLGENISAGISVPADIILL